MIQKVTITRVHWGAVQTANGPVDKIGIKTDVHTDKWLSAFKTKFNAKALDALKEGQVQELVVMQNGDFLNFRLPSKIDYVEQDVEMIKKHLFGGATVTASSTTAVTPKAPQTEEEPDW